LRHGHFLPGFSCGWALWCCSLLPVRLRLAVVGTESARGLEQLQQIWLRRHCEAVTTAYLQLALIWRSHAPTPAKRQDFSIVGSPQSKLRLIQSIRHARLGETPRPLESHGSGHRPEFLCI